MEIREAKVIQEGSMYYLYLNGNEEVMKISLNEDNPNNVKNVFNKLIVDLKKGSFTYQMFEIKDNLYYQISDEYIKQLNRDLLSVFEELKSLGMLELVEV